MSNQGPWGSHESGSQPDPWSREATPNRPPQSPWGQQPPAAGNSFAGQSGQQGEPGQHGQPGPWGPQGQSGPSWRAQQPAWGRPPSWSGQQSSQAFHGAGASQPGQAPYQQGGYQAPYQQGGYRAPYQQGGYQAPYQQGGYQAPYQQGGYQAPYQQGGYQAPYQQGGYQAPYQQGGYQAPYQQGGYQAPYQQSGYQQSWQSPPPQQRGPGGAVVVVVVGVALVLIIAGTVFGVGAIRSALEPSPTPSPTPSTSTSPSPTPTPSPTPSPSRSPSPSNSTSSSGSPSASTSSGSPYANQPVLVANPFYAQELGTWECDTLQQPRSPTDDSMEGWFTGVLECVHAHYEPAVQAAGYDLTMPGLIFFDEVIDTPCGDADPADPDIVPFYCSGNEAIYVPKNDVNRGVRLGALHTAVHEFTHHVQYTLEILNTPRRLELESLEQISRRIELQDNCWTLILMRNLTTIEWSSSDDLEFRDWWANSGSPTHGSGESKLLWYERGEGQTSMGVCNTWAAPTSEVR
ncbi:neutral zinc metallopeptidase [Propionibacteriaceae bacterium Y2011]